MAEDIIAPFPSLWGTRFDQKPVNPATESLDIEYNELTRSWKRLLDTLLPPDQVDFHPNPQDAHDLIALVRSLQTDWGHDPRTHLFERSRCLCDEFLGGLGAHSVLLCTLPDESYASLFYSSLQSLLKALAKYPKVVEDLLRLLINVNESIPVDAGLSTLGRVNTQIVLFYTITFFLLTELIDWYLRLRACHLLSNPSQVVYRHFETLVCAIRGHGFHIMRELTNRRRLRDHACGHCYQQMKEIGSCEWEEARLSQIGLRGEDRRNAAKNTMIRHLMWEVHNYDNQRDRLLDERAHSLQYLHISTSLRPVRDQKSGILCWTSAPVQDLDTTRFDLMYGTDRRFTRTEFQYASSHLQEFFDSDAQTVFLEANVDVMVEEKIMTALREWATSTNSQVIILGGPLTVVSPSPVALVSACYVLAARHCLLPVVSYFCTLPSFARKGVTRMEQGLIALAYSIIRQLVNLLRPLVDSDNANPLSVQSFSLLDGTLKSWEQAVSLIDHLLYRAPPALLLVVDSLDILEDASTEFHIRSLVWTLLTHTRNAAGKLPNGKRGQRVLLKVLFTVKGQPSSVIEPVAENEHCSRESIDIDAEFANTILNR